MRVKLVLLFLVVVITSGCTQTLPDDASDGFDDLKEKSDNSNYHISYEFSTSSDGGNQVESMEIDYYNYDGVTKVVRNSTSSYSSGEYSVYYIDNKTVSCRQTSSSSSCSADNSPELFDLAFASEFRNLNYSGSDSFAGRKCKIFEGTPILPSINPSEYQNLNGKICLDRKLGYPSYKEIEISTDQSEGALTLEATEFDKEVDESDVELPKDISVSVSCYSDPSVTVTALKPVNSVTISIENHNRSLDIGERFESKEFELNESRLSTGTNNLQISTGDYSTEEICNYQDYGYDYSYSYGEAKTSEVDLSQYTVIEDRVSNNDFENMESNEEFSIEGWDHTDGNTQKIAEKDLLDGNSVGTKWEDNSVRVDPASISQEVNLTDVRAIGLDVAGGGGNPHRSKIILEVDGEKEGRFIKSPQKNEEYYNLGVEIDQEYRGVHTIRIKWVHVTGDNLGGSAIDNVRAYR